ncbi:formamidopyrimidine-DNA glycosylase [Pedobacter sp. CG_S7]|uniref:DNA-formamidopyrimidine glycosylase family protein n=1 Tax=Pedobacter sp. CG_S7 TaxID=3143930 RepID=UPI003392A20A
MPELPDLQVFSYNLQKRVTGKKLKEINVLVSKKINVTEADLQQALLHHQINLVKRVGKQLHFQFDNGHVLAFHLMLNGKLLEFEGEEVPKY